MSHWSYPHVVLHAQPEGRIYVELHAGHSWKLNVSVNADAAGKLTPTLIATSVPSSPLPAPAGLVAGCTGYVRIPFDTPVETFLAGGLGWIVSVKVTHQFVDLGTGPRDYSALLEARTVADRHPDTMDALTSSILRDPAPSHRSSLLPVQDQSGQDADNFDALLARFELAVQRVNARRSVADSLLAQKAWKTIRSLQLLVGDNEPPSMDRGSRLQDVETNSYPHGHGDGDSHSV